MYRKTLASWTSRIASAKFKTWPGALSGLGNEMRAPSQWYSQALVLLAATPHVAVQTAVSLYTHINGYGWDSVVVLP